ncbi:MAG: biopolymer transporter ExbD [Gammaproteobacteria bacterium]
MSLIRSRRRKPQEQEMQITAFMNLMVVLVPFLLITAVFSRLSIIELNLPAATPAAQEPPQGFELEVVVRKNAIEVAERNSGLLGRYPAGEQGYDYDALRKKLKELKAQFPDVIAATILLEPDTPYDVVVQVMDTVRTFPAQQGTRTVQAELFPEISIGDAPI